MARQRKRPPPPRWLIESARRFHKNPDIEPSKDWIWFAVKYLAELPLGPPTLTPAAIADMVDQYAIEVEEGCSAGKARRAIASKLGRSVDWVTKIHRKHSLMLAHLAVWRLKRREEKRLEEQREREERRAAAALLDKPRP